MGRVSEILELDEQRLSVLHDYLFGKPKQEVVIADPNTYYRRKLLGFYLKLELIKAKRELVKVRQDYKVVFPERYKKIRARINATCKAKASFKLNFVLDQVLGPDNDRQRLDDFYRRD